MAEGGRAGGGRRAAEDPPERAGKAVPGSRPAQHQRLGRLGRPPASPAASVEEPPDHGQFFIDRPIFAWVIALFILVMGGVHHAAADAQYPPVAPPAIVVNVNYLSGASAGTLEDSVDAVIEREMNGSPGLAYLRSRSRRPTAPAASR